MYVESIFYYPCLFIFSEKRLISPNFEQIWRFFNLSKIKIINTHFIKDGTIQVMDLIYIVCFIYNCKKKSGNP